ncbi:DUF748 domain-containing protein [Ulvibacterium marinum]|uniref:DUF748 domain-containing protein n=1 Tax=Ulvibacterium marinum TaxID=2419782 RepID=A0A3B0C5V8_9FLAO|nr:DUF748 domain-containing protein [Ulvibacterium marinum]RKN78726.1 DUF748 domain-containing protein [Ulvibacterium marinum]
MEIVNSSLKNKNTLKRKRYVIPLIVIVALVLLRVALPYIVKNYVNKVLADIPGYYGHVDAIEISLLRGAYVIEGMYLNKVDALSEVPFLKLEKTDISVEWKSLFKGKVVSELILIRPTFIYMSEDQQQGEEEAAEFDDWTKALTGLVPIDINHLQISDGKAAFVEFTTSPNIDLNLNNIELDANNLKNVVLDGRELPSEVNATATSIGNGNVKMNGKMNLVKQIPDMDISFSLEDASVTAFNDFTNHYAGIDFSEGNFNIYSEMAIADGFLTGYVKPLLKDSKLVSKNDKFFEKLWEGFVRFFKFVLKNQKSNTLATKVPFQGDLNNVQTKVWPTIFNIVQNGWIDGFKSTVDDDVTFEDAEKLADEDGDEDKSREEKKAERQKGRAKRKPEKAKTNNE